MFKRSFFFFLLTVYSCSNDYQDDIDKKNLFSYRCDQGATTVIQAIGSDKAPYPMLLAFSPSDTLIEAAKGFIKFNGGQVQVREDGFIGFDVEFISDSSIYISAVHDDFGGVSDLLEFSFSKARCSFDIMQAP